MALNCLFRVSGDEGISDVFFRLIAYLCRHWSQTLWRCSSLIYLNRYWWLFFFKQARYCGSAWIWLFDRVNLKLNYFVLQKSLAFLHRCFIICLVGNISQQTAYRVIYCCFWSSNGQCKGSLKSINLFEFTFHCLVFYKLFHKS